MEINKNDLNNLKKAKTLLEKKSIAMGLINLFGDAAEDIIRLFPKIWQKKIEDACILGLEKSWEFSITTMSAPDLLPESQARHRSYAVLSGAVGGAGIISLFAEVPVTTLIMIRSIADVARSEGENFREFETKIACLQSFALGGDTKNKNTGETEYYAARSLLEKPLDESTRYIAKKGFAGIGAPFSAQFAAKIAACYQTIISAKAMSNAVPVAGAVVGLGVNIIFINYFQDKARGHFIIRRLEKKYSEKKIRQTYEEIDNYLMEKSKIPAAKIDDLIQNHVYASMGMGLIPVPIIDFMGVTGVQLNLLRKMARLYEIPFSKNMVKILTASLIGGAFPASLGVRLGSSLAKMIPGMGQTIGVAALSLSAGASTYALGRVFHRHFDKGGSFMDFVPAKAKKFYEEMFKQGQELAANIRLRKKNKQG